ncbi:hypothetical protein PF003_g13791 [Phytophthora fragariae]|nr:hypothetical protein PF003_g13791 [Phytophthora fragariae]
MTELGGAICRGISSDVVVQVRTLLGQKIHNFQVTHERCEPDWRGAIDIDRIK